MSETPIQKKILLLASQFGHRLFRSNTGMGWAGHAIHFTNKQTVFVGPGDVLIRKARPLHAGLCEGGSDLLGWTKNGHFLAVEVKVEGKRTDPDRLEKQLNFIRQINNSGGIAGICKNEEDAIKLFS